MVCFRIKQLWLIMEPLTPVAYKMSTKWQKKAFKGFDWPCHINTFMEKIINMLVHTQIPLW
jgi:hypothetical protein